ncbi:MAG TPA: GNAT family N-acetyltransferase [Streptosporangiaceae bacterium]
MSDATITVEPLTSDDALTLIAELNAELTERYPDPAHRFFGLTAEQVAPGKGAFLIARLRERPVGCGALRRIDAITGEIKRMYVSPSARGAGIGARLLAELEAHARALGLRRVVLETGERQHEAVRLYERAGYAEIPRFGEYENSPMSLCMGKTLS